MLKIMKKICLILCLLPAFANAFQAGKDYELLATQNIPADKGKISVIEFFSYGCPGCFRIEEPLASWVKKQGDRIQFEKIPVVFHKDWENYAKAFYTAQSLSLLDKFTPALFKTIQIEKKPLTTDASMVDFFVSQGVDKDLAASAFEHSLTVDMMVKSGMTKMGQYQVSMIPAFIVNHRYKTDLQMAETPERLLEILDHLVNIDKKS